jgi:hypothetical protein
VARIGRVETRKREQHEPPFLVLVENIDVHHVVAGELE